jgi:hypothetical protein
MRLSFIIIAVIASSCAMLGSTSRLHERPEKPLQRVAVFIAPQEVSSEEHSDENLLFTKTLIEELVRLKGFKFKVMKRTTSRETFDKNEQHLTGQNLAGEYDAFLVATPLSRGADYKVELKLFETKPSRLIITARHGTHMGNSYWFQPHPAAVLVDATRGAVLALEKRWVKIQ